MGCEASRNIKIEEAVPGSSKSSLDKGVSFSDLHMDVVRSTWPLLNKDPITTGTSVFRILSTEAPDIKKLFPFR